MSAAKPRPTKRVRVRMDFVIVLPREVDTLPFRGEEDARRRAVTAAWKATIAEFSPGVLQSGDTVECVRGDVQVNLDYRKESPANGGAK